MSEKSNFLTWIIFLKLVVAMVGVIFCGHSKVSFARTTGLLVGLLNADNIQTPQIPSVMPLKRANVCAIASPEHFEFFSIRPS